jgi:hypothetical protein
MAGFLTDCFFGEGKEWSVGACDFIPNLNRFSERSSFELGRKKGEREALDFF